MKYERSSEKAIRKGMPMLFDPNLTIYTESLGDIERIHMKNGRLTYSKPIDKKKVVDSSLQEYAVSVLSKSKAKMIPPVTDATQ